METIVDKSYWGRTDTFEVVNEFPAGYIVWNIGRHNFPHPGFVPLAKPDPNQKYHILLHGLKALRCKDEETALRIIYLAHHRRGVFTAKDYAAL